MPRATWIRAARTLLLGIAGLALLALTLDGVAAWLQPTLSPGGLDGVLRTMDEDGRVHETRLALFEGEDGTLWVQSGHHFRGWYERLKLNPEVELVRNGSPRRYRAVPLETPEALEEVRSLIRARVGVVGSYAIRTFLLFAEIKPVRLDPR